MESPLACSPHTAQPFLQPAAICMLRRARPAPGSQLSFPRSHRYAAAWFTQLSATAFRGFISALPPSYVSQNASRERREQGNFSKTAPTSQARGCSTSLEMKSSPCFQGRSEEQHQTSADTGNYIQIADTRSVIDLFLEGRTSYPVKRGVTLLNSERIITQHEGHSCYWYTSGSVSASDREQRSAERSGVRRQASKLQE